MMELVDSVSIHDFTAYVMMQSNIQPFVNSSWAW